MQNKDLSRFFPDNPKSNKIRQFVRYDNEGKIPNMPEDYATTMTFTAEISTSWTGDSAPYIQIVNVPGILSTDNPIVDIIVNSIYSTAEAQLEAFSKIYKITTENDYITVYTSEATETAITIQLKVVR